MTKIDFTDDHAWPVCHACDQMSDHRDECACGAFCCTDHWDSNYECCTDCVPFYLAEEAREEDTRAALNRELNLRWKMGQGV